MQPVDSAPMRVGLTAATADYATHWRAFPAAWFSRVFFQPGAGLLPWDHPKLAKMPPTITPWVSFKDPVADATLNAWLDGATRPIILTYFHERDNGKTLAEQTRKAKADHFARTRAYWDVVVGHRLRPLVKFMPIQTLQWTAGRTSGTSVRGDGDWRMWWAGVGDGAAIDSYVDSWSEKGYPDPEVFLRIPFELAEGTGRRLWLPELGSVLLGDDRGAGRAAWIRDVMCLLRECNAGGVAWWCALGKAGAKGEVRDFHLSDRASADAWRAAIDGGGK